DPHKGGRYTFQWTTFGSSFQRYEIALNRVVPIFAEDRIGFRAQTTFTQNSGAGETPFFMLPTAARTDTVRRFHQNGVRDNDAFVLNAEYRRLLASLLDVVAFVAAGRVFAGLSDFALTDLHYSEGFGTRVTFGQHVFFGIDLAFSREAKRLWFRS